METDLPAGRELDARIAETIMGWRWFMHRAGLEGSSIPGQRFLYPPDTAAVREGVFVPAPPDASLADSLTSYYSTDIAAAWQVVEAMLARGWGVVLTDTTTPGPLWRCGFVPPPGISVAHTGAARAESVPLAICRAALAVTETA